MNNMLLGEERKTQACEESRKMRTDYKTNLKIIKELNILLVTELTKFIVQHENYVLRTPSSKIPLQILRYQPKG
jgi:hypothetical protein